MESRCVLKVLGNDRRQAPPKESNAPGEIHPVLSDLRTACAREWMIVSFPRITVRTTVATALRLLLEHPLPALPVCEGERLAGLVDERALLRLTPSEATTLSIYEIRSMLDKITVREVVMPPSGLVAPETPLDEVASLMVREGADVIPVVDTDRLLGLLAWTSVLRAVLGDLPRHCPTTSVRRSPRWPY